MQKKADRGWCFLVLLLFFPVLSWAQGPLVILHCDKLLAQWLDIDREAVPWTVTLQVDDLQIADNEVCDFTQKWCVNGAAVTGSVVSAVGSSFHSLVEGKGSHPFDGFENLASLTWVEKLYTDVDPMLSFGYKVWQTLDKHPELIPAYLLDDYKSCEPFDWPGDFGETENIWDEIDLCRPVAEFLQTPHRFVEALVQDKCLINDFLCLSMDLDGKSWFSQWEVDEKGCVQAFEWHQINQWREMHVMIRYDRTSCLLINADGGKDEVVVSPYEFWFGEREVGAWLLDLPEHDEIGTALGLAENPECEENAFQWTVWLLLDGLRPDLPWGLMYGFEVDIPLDY